MTRDHGYSRYRLDGCRCYVCGFARSRYDENRDRAIAYGTWQPWTETEHVRIHIKSLQSCGMGLRAIAAAAPCDRKRLQGVMAGQERMRPEIAARILAVEPSLENLAPSTLIAPFGTRRRVHALVAIGWPQQYLAEHLGMDPGNFGMMLKREQVIVRRALAVRAMYGELWRVDPADHGATPGGIARARAYAADRLWAPPAAWDDDSIDDPAAHPDWTGECGTPAGFNAHRYIGVPPCPPCRDARNAYERERRALRAAANGRKP
ncbi:hypothetical protein ACFYRN_25000 [Streptomyces sp. NPDC005227]|uniref:hypothetical protein n=1 Tax=Streptomyces sp. NPDC005227 TaxID=3364707 RepID=UPI0036982A46